MLCIILTGIFLSLMLIVLPFALRIRSRAKDLEATQKEKGDDTKES
jgi:heme/copper-type cytochrome/quinol oxidase subunit 2